MTNYRPTALLTTLPKVTEKVMHSRFSHHKHTNYILVPEQFGFWKVIPTKNMAFRLTVCSNPFTKKCMLEEYSVN
jgi:hypothetical protein